MLSEYEIFIYKLSHAFQKAQMSANKMVHKKNDGFYDTFILSLLCCQDWVSFKNQ